MMSSVVELLSKTGKGTPTKGMSSRGSPWLSALIDSVAFSESPVLAKKTTLPPISLPTSSVVEASLPNEISAEKFSLFSPVSRVCMLVIGVFPVFLSVKPLENCPSQSPGSDTKSFAVMLCPLWSSI